MTQTLKDLKDLCRVAWPQVIDRETLPDIIRLIEAAKDYYEVIKRETAVWPPDKQLELFKALAPFLKGGGMIWFFIAYLLFLRGIYMFCRWLNRIDAEVEYFWANNTIEPDKDRAGYLFNGKFVSYAEIARELDDE